MEQEADLLHVILWPVVGSILILIALIIILYCVSTLHKTHHDLCSMNAQSYVCLCSECIYITIQCGFFRRKKKPDEGEIEGDFDVPTDGGSKKSFSPENKAAAQEKEEEL